jgi:hypothetical protein
MSRRPREVVVIPSSPTTVGVYTGRPGTIGPTGPTGPAGDISQVIDAIPALVSYRHNQIATSTTWTITHNLRFRPNVTVFDSAGSMVEGSVAHVSANQLTIQFSVALSGTAVLS